jgi:hypothetical protein
MLGINYEGIQAALLTEVMPSIPIASELGTVGLVLDDPLQDHL